MNIEAPTSATKNDLFLLPLLSLLTILFLLVGSEVLARALYPEQEKDSCEIADQHLGFRYKPNCSVRVKAAEGNWVTMQYNDCGYRSKESCKPRTRGTVRIAVVGSSVAQGWLVDYDQSFATRTAKELEQRCHRPVEVQNLGRQLCGLNCFFRLVPEALSLKPDLLLVTLTGSDIDRLSDEQVRDRYKALSTEPTGAAASDKRNVFRRIKDLTTKSRAVEAIEHFLFQDPSTYLRIALLNKQTTGFMSSSYSPAWQRNMRNTETLLSEMAAESKAAGVPMAIVPFPSVAQSAAIVSKGSIPDVYPDALNNRLAKIAEKNGIIFVDPMPTFQKTPSVNRFYFIANGHLDGEGQALISTPIVDRLTTGSSPVFVGCTAPTQQSTGGTF